MNKRDAKKAAEQFTGSIDDLRKMVASADRSGVSTVNPSLSKERALGIFESALAERDGSEKPKMWSSDPYSRNGATGDRLLVQNIFRECGTVKRDGPPRPSRPNPGFTPIA